MGVLSNQLQLSFHYTNHCIQATGMTLLNKPGFEACHIYAISSHKNESTIRNYAVKCPDSKKCDMSNTLASALVPAKIAKLVEKTPESTVPEDAFLDEVNWEEDDALIKLLEKIEKQNKDLPVPPEPAQLQRMPENPGPSSVLTMNNNVSNVTNMRPPRVPMPMMYFPGSNVTINYNFQQ